METVKGKKGVRYREMIWIDGRAIKGPLFSKKSDAKAWRAMQVAMKQKKQIYGKEFISPAKTVEEFFQEWIEEVIKASRTLSTYHNYVGYFKNHILPRLGKYKLDQLTRKDFQRLIASLQKENKSHKTINDILAAFRSMISEAKRRELIVRSPLDTIQNLKIEPKADIFLSKKQISEFLDAQRDKPLYSLFLVAFYTGLRRGELAGLLWDRVDFEQNLLVVSRTKSKRYGLKDTTKSNRIRFVPMTNEVKQELLQLANRHLRSDFVFCDDEGNGFCPDYVSRYFKREIKKLGWNSKMRFHDIRHSFASNFVMNSGSLFELQKILGHSDLKVTQRYAHFAQGYMQNSLRYMRMEDTPRKPIYPKSNQKDCFLSLCN